MAMRTQTRKDRDKAKGKKAARQHCKGGPEASRTGSQASSHAVQQVVLHRVGVGFLAASPKNSEKNFSMTDEDEAEACTKDPANWSYGSGDTKLFGRM